MATQSTLSDHLFLLDTLEDHQDHIVQLLNKGQYSVLLMSEELNPHLFEQTEVIESLSRIARNGAVTDVRLIIKNPQAMVDNNPKLLNLARRLPSKISIQTLTIDPPDNKAFMLVDENSMWLQHDHQIISGENTGFANSDARAEVKQYKERFKELWRYSQSDVRLRTLSL